MVAICAGCAYVEPWAAICIGAIAGVVYVCINKVAEMALIDDPLGATAVHLVRSPLDEIQSILSHSLALAHSHSLVMDRREEDSGE